ncbi:MAG: hypothetical protein QOC68_3710 [Solirubrobacteraceae bacterium]|nr:hypothetical protein [Solirubrobacteraceae bacterium]
MFVLEAYRRTGADPPFGDPRRAHGVRFEGYYWRFTDAAAGRVVIVLCGVCRDAAGTWAVVALAGHPGGLVRSRIVPLARADGSGLGVEAGDVLHGTTSTLRVDLGPDARLDVALQEPRPWPRRVFGGIGAPQIVPGLPQYWHPHLLGARVAGEARLGETTVDLSGATAYAEKNWGPAFTEHWWWGQAQGFSDADACVAFAGGRIALGPAHGAPTAVVVALEGRVLRLAPPFARMTTAVGAAGWRVHGRSARHTVELEGEAVGPPAVLPVPVPGRREVTDRSHQYLAGRLRVVLRRGRRTVFAGESSLAGLERWA